MNFKPNIFLHCIAAWAGSIPMAMMCILAPMASWVLNRYSLRLCTALLAIPIGLLFLVTSYARNMDEVIAAFSIPFGLTSCMLLMISSKSLQVYFDKRMLTANGEFVNGFFRILVGLFSWRLRTSGEATCPASSARQDRNIFKFYFQNTNQNSRIQS